MSRARHLATARDNLVRRLMMRNLMVNDEFPDTGCRA